MNAICFALFVVSAVAVPQYQPYSQNLQNVPIISQTNDIYPDGRFSYSYQSGDGQQAEARGAPRASATSHEPAEVIQGSYSYTAPNGSPVAVKYTADEFGFHPEGSHIALNSVVQPEKSATNQEFVYQPKVTAYSQNYYRSYKPYNSYHPYYNRRY
ncbi:endocuticle structural glycoprotein SgAbd-8-like [Agrilus planipennis]|uniref:Endocuticle structural glycoprotein SgAbd-8-like n=1 Tax=Agrilus planipennis TaxID=224129 RepID=A0A1W4XHL2_AGRPL|nr:endocuticle structural glycoprotein SgAbd-8-like [Agrilus planipennis]